MGVDLGQRHDPTAVAVVEQAEVETGFDHAYWRLVREQWLSLRHLERLRNSSAESTEAEVTA